MVDNSIIYKYYEETNLKFMAKLGENCKEVEEAEKYGNYVQYLFRETYIEL